MPFIPSAALLQSQTSPYYAAPPPNGTDDTVALEAAFAAAGNRKLILSAGNYVYNGTGLVGTRYSIEGQGYGATTVTLNNNYFINTSVAVNSTFLKGITFEGGKGAIRYTFASNPNLLRHIVEDCYFHYYTQTAIASLSLDMANWSISRCVFLGLFNTVNIGVAFAGLTDECVIDSCDFTNNKVHVKVGLGGNFLTLRDTEFYQITTGTSRAAVWVVPTAQNGSGPGTKITGCKFGSENADATDYGILFADEGSGTDFSDKLFNVSADSTGYVAGHTYVDCLFNLSYARPLIYSTTPNIQNLEFFNPILGGLGGVAPSYLIQFRTVPIASSRFNTTNRIGPVSWVNDLDSVSIPISNADGIGYVEDPAGVLLDNQSVLHRGGGIDLAEYVNLLPSPLSAWTLGGSMTKSVITDVDGGDDAYECTAIDSNSTFYMALTFGSIRIGDPIWIEFDLQVGSSSPVSYVRPWLDNGAVAFWRTLTPRTNWRRYRYLTYLRSATNPTNFAFHVSGAGKFKVGRPACYHGREPVPFTIKTPRGDLSTAVTLTDGANVASDWSQGDYFKLTTSLSRTISAPTRLLPGQRADYEIHNGSGGAITTTWNAVFHLAGAWTDPAAGKSRIVSLRYDGTNILEISRSAGDIS